MLYFFFYYPLGLDVRSPRTGWASLGLITTAVAVFVASRVVPGPFWRHAEALIYVPAAPRLEAVIANAYLHGDWLHLGSNLIALSVFGPALEARLGAWRFLAIYHLLVVCGNLVQATLALFLLPQMAGSGVLGASGAIAGLMGLFLVRLHFARLHVGYWAFLPLQAYTRAGAHTLPVLAAVLLWFLTQVGLVLAQTQGGEVQIAVGAHLGGLAGGVLLGFLLGLHRDAEAEHHFMRGRRYVGRAQWYPAQTEFLEYVRRRPEDAEGHAELARTYRLVGRHDAADEHHRAACVRFARAGHMDRVEEIHREAERANPDFVLPAALQLQLAKLLERAFKPEAAERLYRNYANFYATQRGAAFALYRAARLAQARQATSGARALYRQLLDQHPDSAEAEFARRAGGCG